MKKRLLFALSALLALPVMAQEEDVTNYIQNAGFDEDLTWQADGSTKPIVNNTAHYGRSYAWEAADGSLYAHPDGTCEGKPRTDGLWEKATNGFIGQVQGWTLETNQDYPKSEWVYFGTIPYDLGPQAIPIADNGKDFLTVPAKPDNYNTDDNIGFVYMRAGWGGRAIYKQTVNLPCAQYRLEYWAININPSGKNGTNLSKVTCRKDTWKDETGFNDTEWTLHTIEFTPTSEFTMEFGFESVGGSGSNPYLCIDGIKLYKIGEADPVELLRSDLSDLMDECSELSGQASLEGFNGLATQIGEYSMNELEEYYLLDVQEDLEASLKDANAMIAKFKEAINIMEDYNAILTKIENLLQNTDYPGKDALQAFQLDMIQIKENDDYEDGFNVAEEMLAAIEKANEALKEYYMSQKSTASDENPADFTFLVKNPWFIDAKAEPNFENDEWVFPKRYDAEGNDLYKNGSASSPDLTSDGWYVAGATGGDQRLNWVCGRSCWNAWNNNFTTTIAVAQDLTDLPNGYYTVSADLITQAGYVTNQHVFAQSTATKNISEPMTTDLWDESIWETVAMTPEQKVLVVDGKLTIGAEGTGSGENAAGWFCVTNFRLNFLGEASQEAITAAVKESFEARISEAKQLAEVMMFAADKKALNDSIAKFEGANDYESYIAALDGMRLALDEAKKSEALYYEYLPTEEAQQDNPDLRATKTLYWVQDLLNDIEVEGHDQIFFEGTTKPIAQFALDYVNSYIVCDTATYKQFDAVVNLLKNYVNTYIPAYNNAEQIADQATEKGKAALMAVMQRQQAALISEMKDKETIDAYISELNGIIEGIKKQNIYDDPNATDYTAFIKNPKAEATDGWTFEMGNGDGNGEKGAGQWMDDSNTRYFDSYNSGGLKGFKASQLIKDLPNGTYNVGVYTRTPAEGAYIFYAVESDTTFVEIPLDYYKTVTELGDDTLIIASDQHGPIWEDAKVKVEEEGSVDDFLHAIYNANSGNGRGWKHQEMNGIVVKNHELLIGTMTGTEASQTPKVFAGTWYSVGGWTLTLVSKGDNSGWEGPIGSGIANVVVTANNVADGIYNLSGVKTSKLQRGINIVVNNGKAHKVILK